MFLIRQAIPDDIPALVRFAKMVHSNNLPATPDLILPKVLASRRSFERQVEDRRDGEFMFVLEDTDTGNVVGTSSIVAAMGGPGRPHLFFQVRKHEHYSQDLQTGHVHVTLQLGTDESGPTEIGGLVLSPAYRGRHERLGSLLSLIRFHFIALHREWFAERVIAEMMGSLTPDSRNTLWEYLGRRFINLSYEEADSFSRKSKEFVLSLFPRVEIYASLLPPEARSLIGRVGEDARPALTMLERMGFRYRQHVDPFDGGPYLEAALDEIPLVRETRVVTLAGPAESCPQEGLVSVAGPRGFRATRAPYMLEGESLRLPPAVIEGLGAAAGAPIGLSPARPPASEAPAQDDSVEASSPG